MEEWEGIRLLEGECVGACRRGKNEEGGGGNGRGG